MHSCDYTGGAWFRSTNAQEEHAFFDPAANQLYKNNGSTSSLKLISVANSKRGHYFALFYNTTNGRSNLTYSSRTTFWTQQTTGINEWPSYLHHKFVRLDVPNTDKRIFYIALAKSTTATNGTTFTNQMRVTTYSSFVEAQTFQVDYLWLWYSNCDMSTQMFYTQYSAPDAGTLIKEIFKIDSLSNFFAVQIKVISTGVNSVSF